MTSKRQQFIDRYVERETAGYTRFKDKTSGRLFKIGEFNEALSYPSTEQRVQLWINILKLRAGIWYLLRDKQSWSLISLLQRFPDYIDYTSSDVSSAVLSMMSGYASDSLEYYGAALKESDIDRGAILNWEIEEEYLDPKLDALIEDMVMKNTDPIGVSAESIAEALSTDIETVLDVLHSMRNRKLLEQRTDVFRSL